MNDIVFFSILLLLFLAWSVCKISLDLRVYLIAILIFNGDNRVPHLGAFLFISYYIIHLLLSKKFFFNKKTGALFLILILSPYLSLLNNASLISVLYRSLQSTSLLAVMLSVDLKKVKSKDVSLIGKAIFFASFTFSLFSGNSYANGIFRFQGIFFDPNYACLYYLGFAYYFRYTNNRLWSYIYIAISLLTISLTGYFILFIYLLLSSNKYIKHYFNKRVGILFMILLTYAMFLIGILNYINSIPYANLFIYKIVSLQQRLGAQIVALNLLSNDLISLFIGYGSGRSVELTGKALHNGYMQIILSHGLLFFTATILITYKYCFDFIIKKNDMLIVIMSIIANYSLDLIYTYYLFFVLVIIYAKSNFFSK